MSAISPEDGRVLWRTDVYGWTFGTPLLVGDRIFAGADSLAEESGPV